MRLIDADFLEKEGWSLHRTYQKDKTTMVYEVKAISEINTAQPDVPDTNVGDMISRQAAIDALDEIRHALWEIDIPSPTVPEYQVQSVWKLLDKKQKELYLLPSAHPSYTDEQISKMQELEQAEIEKAFQLGREDAQQGIIRCKECEYWRPHHQLGFDEDNDEYHDYCERLIPDDEFYAFYRNADDFCSRAKRRENG